MERAGLRNITVGCRGGGCGICKVKVVEGTYRTGKTAVSRVAEMERAAGYALACRLFPLDDLSIEYIGLRNDPPRLPDVEGV
jgi:ferredoxin